MLRRRFIQLIGISLFAPFMAKKAVAVEPKNKVFLQEVYVAGYQYHQGMQAHVQAQLAVGQELSLMREPDNQYDQNAIAVLSADGHKLGYIPRSDNEIPATIAEQKRALRAIISVMNPSAPTWERLAIRTFMEV